MAITFPGFKDLGRSMTPTFLLTDHFLYRFSAFSEENLSTRIPFFLAPHSALSDGFKCLLKTLVTFGIIYATDPLLQDMTKYRLPPLNHLRYF